MTFIENIDVLYYFCRHVVLQSLLFYNNPRTKKYLKPATLRHVLNYPK